MLGATCCLKLKASGGQQVITIIKRFQKTMAKRSSVIYRVNESMSCLVGHLVTLILF